MVYTLSLNPTIDYDIYFDAGSDGANKEVNQASRVRYRASGKGVNVSKALKTLGMDSAALGFAGGFTGKYLRDALKAWGIAENFVGLAGTTRINVKIFGAEGESEITGVSPEITDADFEKLEETLRAVKPGDALVLTGSVPPRLPDDIYKRIAEKLPDGVLTVLDARGAALRKNLWHNYLLKPNKRELSEVFGVNIADKHDAAEYGKRLLETGTERGAKNVIVSLGGDGAVFLNGSANYYTAVPDGVPVNTIGAGDSVVAGFLYAKLNSRSDTDAFKLAAAFGSATAFSDDIGSKDSVLKLFDKIKITTL